jgi:hypothetical protein
MRRFLHTLWAVGVLSAAAGLATGAEPASKIWPGCDEGTVHLIEGLPNAVAVGYPVAPEAKEVPAGLYPVVELPAYVELISTTYNYSRPTPPVQVTESTREGRPYRRHVFPPPHKDTDRWARLFAQWVPRPTDADRAAPGLLVWHFETPQGPEPEQALPVRLLPELPDVAPPPRLQIRLWQSSMGNVVPERLREVLVLWRRVGFNVVPWWESRVEDLRAAGAADLGLGIAADQSGHAGWPQMATPSPAPDYQNRDCTGKELPDQDPQWVLDNAGAPWSSDLDYCRRHAGQVDVLSEDIEWNPGGFNTGFSPAAIRAFAKSANLDPAGLTPQSIWQEHRRQWGDFRAAQTLELVKLYYRAAKEGNPNALFQFLPGSPYTTTDTATMSGMVPLAPDSLGRMVHLLFPFPMDRLQEAMDVVMPMWYDHGVSQCRSVFAWSRALAPAIKVPLMPCLLGQGREFYYPGGDAGEVLRAMNWAVVLGGSRGYCYWLGEFSPLQLTWLARCGRELGRLEDVLLDGKADPDGVTIEPLPQRRFTLVRGEQKRSFDVPDFGRQVLWRAFALGNRRLVGVINLDQGLDAYLRLSIGDLPAGGYRLVDVSEDRLLCPAPGADVLAAADLAGGVTLRTPQKYGVSLFLVQPEAEPLSADILRLGLPELEAAYAAYRQPDSTGAVLAERGDLVVRYDMAGRDGAMAILIESPQQQVWLRTQDGGRIGEWRIRDGNRTVVEWESPYGGAAADLFWSPSNAHWTGDELGPYELVEAKIHATKAYVTLRQSKQTPALQGLVVTKTIIVPEDRPDIEVRVDIANAGPAPEIGFASWMHHVFRLGTPELGTSEPRQHPQVFMETQAGPTEAPAREVVWCKPGAAYVPGNESWEKRARNGEVTGEWIAQRNPVTGEVVLCQVLQPPVVQFYSWRDEVQPDNLSLEWMHAYGTLAAGKTWRARYLLRYVKATSPEALPQRLQKPVPE